MAAGAVGSNRLEQKRRADVHRAKQSASQWHFRQHDQLQAEHGRIKRDRMGEKYINRLRLRLRFGIGWRAHIANDLRAI